MGGFCPSYQYPPPTNLLQSLISMQACRTSHIFMLLMHAIEKTGRQKRATSEMP